MRQVHPEGIADANLQPVCFSDLHQGFGCPRDAVDWGCLHHRDATDAHADIDMHGDLDGADGFFHESDGPCRVPRQRFISVGTDSHTVDTGTGRLCHPGLLVGVHSGQLLTFKRYFPMHAQDKFA